MGWLKGLWDGFTMLVPSRLICWWQIFCVPQYLLKAVGAPR